MREEQAPTTRAPDHGQPQVPALGTRTLLTEERCLEGPARVFGTSTDTRIDEALLVGYPR